MNYGDSEAVKKEIDKLFNDFKKNEEKYYKKIYIEIEKTAEFDYLESLEPVHKYQNLYLELVSDVGKILKKVKKTDPLIFGELVGANGYTTLKFREFKKLKDELDKRIADLYLKIKKKSLMKGTITDYMLVKAVLKAGYIFRGEGQIRRKGDQIEGETGLISLAKNKYWKLKGGAIFGTYNKTVADTFGEGTTMLIKTDNLKYVWGRPAAVNKECVFYTVNDGIPTENIHTILMANSEQYNLAIELLTNNGFKIKTVGDERSEISYKSNKFICGNIKSSDNQNEFKKFLKKYHKVVMNSFKRDALRVYKLINRYIDEKDKKWMEYSSQIGNKDMAEFFDKGMMPENDVLIMLLAGFEYLLNFNRMRPSDIEKVKNTLAVEMDTKKLKEKLEEYFD